MLGDDLETWSTVAIMSAKVREKQTEEQAAEVVSVLPVCSLSPEPSAQKRDVAAPYSPRPSDLPALLSVMAASGVCQVRLFVVQSLVSRLFSPLRPLPARWVPSHSGSTFHCHWASC